MTQERVTDAGLEMIAARDSRRVPLKAEARRQQQILDGRRSKEAIVGEMQHSVTAVQGIGQIDSRTESKAAGHNAVLVVAQPQISRKVLERFHLVLNINAGLTSSLSPAKIKRFNLDVVVSRVEVEVFAKPEQHQVDTGFDGIPRAGK